MPIVVNDNYNNSEIGGSGFDVCGCCVAGFEGLPLSEWIEHGESSSRLVPYNGEGWGRSTLVGGFPHQCYGEQSIKCACCGFELDEDDNDPDHADTLYY